MHIEPYLFFEGRSVEALECSGKPNFAGFSLSVTKQSKEEAERAFRALSEGGEVKMPLTNTFFSPAFGMLTDRFGVGWMVMVPGANKP